MPAASAVRRPADLDAARAAAFTQSYAPPCSPCATGPHLQPGETVLVLGAGGGVGLATIDVARALGARAIGAASTADKRGRGRRLGADAVIDTTTESLKDRARELARRAGSRPAGGADRGGPGRRPGRRRPGRAGPAGPGRGRPLPGDRLRLGHHPRACPLNQVLLRNRSVVGRRLGGLGHGARPGPDAPCSTSCSAWWPPDRLHPPAPTTYPLERVGDALDDLLGRRVVGKVGASCPTDLTRIGGRTSTARLGDQRHSAIAASGPPGAHLTDRSGAMRLTHLCARLRPVPHRRRRAAASDEPLSIAYLTYRGKPHVGGQGVYTRHLTKALVDLGHHVEVLGGQPYPVLDERVPLHELPSLDIYNDYFPMRMPGVWELKTLGDWVEVTRVLAGHLPRAAGLQRAGRPAPARAGSTSSTWCRTTSASATACWPCERMGLPVLATIHHPITVDRRLEMEHAETPWQRFSKARWYAFTKMQTRVAVAHDAASSRCRRTPSTTSTPTTRCRRDRMHVVPVGVDQELFRPLARRRAHPGPPHHHRVAPTSP